jgi:hypothetical protein
MENVRNVEANTAAAQECCAPAAESGWLNPRNLLIGVAVAGGAGALVFGWDWLVAAGVASIIIAVAPCLVMCVLGLCMNRGRTTEQNVARTPPATPGPDAQQHVNVERATASAEAHVLKADPVSGRSAAVSGNAA